MNIADGLKRLVIGRKLASTQLGERLMPKRLALPVFASDALSSVAYAPDEILLTLSLAGMAGFAFSWQVGIAVAVVMLVVVWSYRQIVRAYPRGRGDYEVARVNLGQGAGVTVAAALLIDYTLTVAVSVSSGVQNAKAMLPFLEGNEVLAAVVVIIGLALVNLRGMRESSIWFVVPTYAFIFAVTGMVLWGLVRIVGLGETLTSPTADWTVVGVDAYSNLEGFVLVALLARSFSTGSAALTGVETISSGVPSFKEPKSKNAATTLAAMALISITMLLGTLALARLTGVHQIDVTGGSHFVLPDGTTRLAEGPTVIAQLASAVFAGSFPLGFYLVITSTILILVLAANNGFTGFPALGSVLARDGHLPKRLHARGDRLTYSNGILTLAIGAVAVVVIFGASVTALIQLYVVGVFLSFTITQFGMVKHWSRHLLTERDPVERQRMTRARVINAVGFVLTALVLGVVLVSKFTHGAWLVVVAIIGLVVVMRGIRRHYDMVADELRVSDEVERVIPSRVRGIILVNAVDKPTVRAVMYAKATRPSDLEAVHVSVDPQVSRRVLDEWEALDVDVPLRVVSSPYREVTSPFVDYVKGVRSGNPRDAVTVYIPEYVVGWWLSPLHNQTALLIRTRLHFITGVMVTSVPFRLRSSKGQGELMAQRHPATWRRPGTPRVPDPPSDV
ncbi:APC family permease [Propionibacteriaceae bacterium Y1923]